VIAVATSLSVLVTAIYVILTYHMLGELRKQNILASECVVSVLPEADVGYQGEGVGRFTLRVQNTSPAEVRDVRINTDYLLAFWPPDEPLRLIHYGDLRIGPDTTIQVLKPGQGADFHVSFEEVLKLMNVLYQDSKIKGGRMRVMRVLVRYRRALDYRKFETRKAYTIAGGGESLVDGDLRGLEPSQMRFSDVKAAMGVQ